MSVDVARDADGDVTENLRDDLQRDAVLNHHRRGGVPQRVQADSSGQLRSPWRTGEPTCSPGRPGRFSAVTSHVRARRTHRWSTPSLCSSSPALTSTSSSITSTGRGKTPAMGSVGADEASSRCADNVAGMALVVIGAQGALGRLCVDALRMSGLEVLRAGRRQEEAADFRFVDLDEPESIAKACADADLVVNTVRHPAHPAERVILREGGTLINVASLTSSDRAELKSATGDGGGLVVLHAGLAPGVYSLMFKEMLAAHPDADTLELAGAWSVFQTSGPGGATDGLYSGLGGGGRRVTRLFEFAEPIGRRRCFHLGGAEIGFFGEVAIGREARAYICIHERPIQAALLALNAVGLLPACRGPPSRSAAGGPKGELPENRSETYSPRLETGNAWPRSTSKVKATTS